MIRKITLSLILAGLFHICFAQIDYTEKDFDIYSQYMSDFAEYKELPINELVIETAKHFLGTPYVAATLEKNEEEQLVVNLQEFDCTTFVENMIALSSELKKGNNQSFSDHVDFLKNMRYRKGIVDGYVSRIHYTSEWVGQNTHIFHNITEDLGGEVIHKKLSFMTSNAHLYPKLKNNDENIRKLREVESSLDHSHSYILLEKSKIEEAAKDIKDGDIIIFGTRASGLDYSHIGLAVWEDDVLKLLHASSTEKKVVIDEKSLVDYCNSSKSCTGITILRLND